jgi:NADH:ubiquinone oxidoreductase subunit E
MNTADNSIDVTICLGSSCFARGNGENLAILKNFAQNEKNRLRLHLTGSLCQEHCKQGPNLTIDGESHHGIHAEALRALLRRMGKYEANHDAA